jgi:phage tail protein X
MAEYITKVGDMLDAIVNERYGDTTNGIVEHVLEANPGLELQGLILEPGLVIVLPDRAITSNQEVQVITQIRLWD